MAEALVSNTTRDLFSEASQIKGRNNILPTSVDDALLMMILLIYLLINTVIYIIVYHMIKVKLMILNV